MRYCEIGSEFWRIRNEQAEKLQMTQITNAVWLLSGRTALDYIIRDIKKERKFRSVMLPSYCCESMIEPFLRNGIQVFFYSVVPGRILYDYENACDAILVLDYFGYETQEMQTIAKTEQENGKIVIYDSTHRLTGNSKVQRYASYSFCSYRKWRYCNYAVANKHTGSFALVPPQKEHVQYLNLREAAAEQKAEFVLGGEIDKSLFLEQFGQAEEILDAEYVGYAGQAFLYDWDSVCSIRRRNAEILISGLKDVAGIAIWADTLQDTDTPLFVPIRVNADQRDSLRRYMISNSVYCPVHWPLSDLHRIPEQEKRIYTEELSLICDQRYGKADMDRQVELISNFFEG